MNDDYAFELVLTETGGATLSQGDELMWSSDDDDAFAGDFEGGEVLSSDDIPDVLTWLVDEGYIPPGVSVAIDDNGRQYPLTAEPGDDYDDLEDDDDDLEDDDDDDDEE